MGRLSKCSGCGITKYCGRDCQVAHWKGGHKAECKALGAGRKATQAAPPGL